MNLKRFFVYSLAVHAFFIALMVFIVPAPEKKKAGGEFFADLVSPEEVRSPKALMLPQRARPAVPSRPKSAARAPEIRNKRSMPAGRGTAPAVPESPSGDIRDARTVPPSEGTRGQREVGAGGILHPPERPVPALREGLFDKTIINNLARRNTEKDDKRDKTFTFDAKEYRFLFYNRRLKERIESIWHYPPEAAAKGIYGDLVIRFTIKKNGRLGAVELVRTSGHENLDDAAMEALKDGEPYWPLPSEWDMEAYTIEGHFVYSLYGYYIR